ncbi:MAG: hypothetical protein C0392_07005 [Syntrophus sp. (in: bacteria)]|nr:hypothetical protein [Syntrophus sp. (in: bacteria)]
MHIRQEIIDYFVKRGVALNFNELKRNDSKSREEILFIQRKKLLRLLTSTLQGVPYYRTKFGYLLTKINIDTVFHVYGELPILNKEIISSEGDSLIHESCNRSKLVPAFTGGSSGSPLTFRQPRYYKDIGLAADQRNLSRMGYIPGDKIFHIVGDYYDKNLFRDIRYKIAYFMRNHYFFSAFDLSTQALKEMADTILKNKIPYIMGYASSIYSLAKYVNENDIVIDCVRGISPTSETLYDHFREEIEKAFQCKIYNRYGCCEVAGVACECQKGKMHLMEDIVFLEEKQIDEIRCKVLLTALDNLDVPFIKYDVGDSIYFKTEECNCGLPFRTIRLYETRTFNDFKKKDGSIVSGLFFMLLLRFITGIQSYQFRQVDLSKIQILYVPNDSFDTNTVDILKRTKKIITDKFDGEVSVELKEMSSIPKTNSGKFHFVISDIV